MKVPPTQPTTTPNSVKQTKRNNPNEHQQANKKNQNQAKKKNKGEKPTLTHTKLPNKPKPHSWKTEKKKPHSWYITSSPTQNFLGNIMKLLSWKTFFMCLKNPAPQRWRSVDRMKACRLMVYQCTGCLDVTMLSHWCVLQLLVCYRAKF